MKILTCLAALAAFPVVAGPSVTGVSLSSGSDSSMIRVDYTVSGEPAVVTVDFKVDGEMLPDAEQTALSGEINRRVGVGAHRFVWTLPARLSGHEVGIAASVRAWSTNHPPVYMSVSLTNAAEAVGYYTSTNRLPVALSDPRWYTSHMLLRKIPAANLVWTMGAPDTDPDRNPYGYENRRKVMLTRDYYLGVFPVTIGQFKNLRVLSGYADWVDSLYYLTKDGIAATDDLARGNFAYGAMRGTGATGSEAQPNDPTLIWPGSGHERIDESCLLGMLRTQTGLQFDLPSEAEWEFACRAETFTTYYTGENYLAGVDRLNSLAWYDANSTVEGLSVKGPHPVGRKRPNGYGLYDMYGNVCEMCLDWFAPFTASETDVVIDPVGAASYTESKEQGRKLATGTRTVRGGSYLGSAATCRSSARGRYAASYNTADCGMRLWLPARADR